MVEKIKQHRKKLKISQTQLATKSGVSLGSIKRFESKYEISLNSFIKILIVPNLERAFNGEHATKINGEGKNPALDDILAVVKNIGLKEKLAKDIALDIQEKCQILFN